MTLLVVNHRVRDFAAWKPVFDEHQAVRTKHGATRHWLYQDADEPNDVTVATEFPTREQAQAFVDDPSLAEAMGKAGVEGPPHIHFREPVEQVDY
jgi:hypothetical protein